MREPSLAKGQQFEQDWNDVLQQYKEQAPQAYEEFQALQAGGAPAGWKDKLPTFSSDDEPDATRKHANKCLNAVAAVLPGLIGGAADLASSVKTDVRSLPSYPYNQYLA